MFKDAFLKRFTIKDSNVVNMTELKTFKITGIIKEYIAVYEDLHNQAPNTINFDKTGPQLDFYNGLPTSNCGKFDSLVINSLVIDSLVLETIVK
ncbi:hypothetical protein DSO57_1033255 [Entomophthora muscae]|uniref:Uncharacterized protein n=1 Tax=Entomophthora muscae TaxID=34485 RepID=A0ACC2T0D1_9FUNG|nr:hypothetical protein DSO57_1033255 [Entomophthora muscae]